MAQESKTQDKRQYFVRIEIGVSAQFYVEAHKPATIENLVKYFNSSKFSNNENVSKIIHFLNAAASMGCNILEYKNPLSETSTLYAEFHVEVPDEKANEFETEFAKYFYFK